MRYCPECNAIGSLHSELRYDWPYEYEILWCIECEFTDCLWYEKVD